MKDALTQALNTPDSPGQEPAIKVLMVDDQAMVCEAVRRMLAGEPDIAFHSINDPAKAIETALEIKPTVILQDLVMPDIDGLTLVKFFRAKAETSEVPMIVLSSKEEPETKKKAFELGANDYMVKLPDKLEVIARIRYHSKGYLNLLQRKKAEAALQAELEEAARYVRSLFPDPMENDLVKTDWVFISSSDLAGDTFGYHDLDDEHFAIYLLDVTGHGVGAALHSVSAINVLRAQSLPGVDFRDPGAVLSGLNEAFDMDKHNQMYFTLWYGVFHRPTRTLKFSSGGHPPAVLITDPARPQESLETLFTPGMVIGGMPGAPFTTDSTQVPSGSTLYVFSDGVYEVDYADGHGMMTEEEFGAGLCLPPEEGKSKVASMVDWVRRAQGRDPFEDDFSLMEIIFK
ncbi:SpoIIE family protein phosphatase [Ruficoccus amylovorans]|uniref:SpoIIE family protein phosphatase n=1 Tax=Ruficoccus amylovorans TaxID=1804625 RepID=A0A842HGZ1_9BACT|nr:SpoIIE family protein phosphatase [Ruficoccus amylovorans]MBC2594511.1 SpoIIE family protein phosphatase [Ruficoccus amylovorans]